MTGTEFANGVAWLLTGGGAVVVGAIGFAVRLNTRVNYMAMEIKRLEQSLTETKKTLFEIRDKVVRIEAKVINGKS